MASLLIVGSMSLQSVSALAYSPKSAQQINHARIRVIDPGWNVLGMKFATHAHAQIMPNILSMDPLPKVFSEFT